MGALATEVHLTHFCLILIAQVDDGIAGLYLSDTLLDN